MENRYCVIMCGGVGSRFWPFSKTAVPKQFLDFFGTGRTLLQMTYDRISSIIPARNILALTNERYAPLVKQQLPDLDDEQILLEPDRRNTAPCIAWSAYHIRAFNPDALILVTPSDHLILKDEEFRNSVVRGFEFVRDNRSALLTMGIKPNRPETGYGYIETGAEIKSKHQAYEVASFREKPDSKTAQQYIDEGRFLWNSGMFIFDAQTMHEELELHVPKILSGIEDILSGDRTVEEAFCRLTSISIDYSVMEHTKRARVIRARFPWDDLGTWESIARYYERDQDGNAASGRVVIADSKNVFVMNKTPRVVGVLGLKDITVVSSEDGILVMDSSCSQDVRQLAIVVRFLGPAKSEKKRNDEKSS